MNILPVKPVETLDVRPVAIATLPDRIIPTLPTMAQLPPHIVPTLPTGNTGIVPPWMREAAQQARAGHENTGVVPPWLVDGAQVPEVDPTLVGPDGPVDEDTPRIL